MPFRQLMNDRVTLVKKDGQRFENIPASVQSNLIFTQNPQIPIEDGDCFERRLPSGVVESFVILDAGFHQRLHSIPAHYQSRVRKETGVAIQAPSTHTVYNLIGPNTRVNIQSSDASTNVVNVEASALFVALRKAIAESVQDANVKQRLTDTVGGMEATVGSRTFSERYKEFIGLVADHMTVFAPFLPALSQLLL